MIVLTKDQFTEIVEKLRSLVYNYNSKITASGFYLKPTHLVYRKPKKYIYIGRYWYFLVRDKGKLRWIYAGKRKPQPWLPDPPVIPNGVIVETNQGYLVDETLISSLLESYKIP
jgi:hypothetical protein